MLRDLKIKAKLIIGLMIIVLFVIFIGIVGIYSAWQTASAFGRIISGSSANLQYLLEIKSLANEIEAQTLSFELLEEESTVSEGMSASDRKFSLLGNVEKIEIWVEKYKENKSGEQEVHAENVRKIDEAKDRIVVVALDFLRLKEQFVSAQLLLDQKNRLEEARKQLKDAIQNAVTEQLHEFQNEKSAVNRLIPIIITANISATFAALMISLMIGFILSKKIVTPIIELRDATFAIFHGDFSRRVKVFAVDEIGELANSFNSMAAKIQQEMQSRIQEEQKFRLVVESSPQGIMTVSEQGNILLVNTQLEKMFGYSRTELQNQKVEILIPHRYHQNHLEDRQKYTQAPLPRAMGAGLNLFGLHKDGSEFPVDIGLTPIQLSEENVILTTITDLTERKQMEKQLLQSRKMAAVGQLAAGVAHEINNPLGVILGFTQGMVRRIQPGDAKEHILKTIEREALRCKNLVRDLLAFSRVETMEKQEVEFNQVIKTVITIVKPQAKLNNIEFVEEFEDDRLKLLANGNQIQQIIINLVNNAMDAMPKGGRITIKTCRTELEGKNWILTEIRDTGEGIPAEIQHKIFDPFFTTKEVGKGTGLGLSLVFEIVERHGGRIEVQSEVGKGAVFQVLLPFISH